MLEHVGEHQIVELPTAGSESHPDCIALYNLVQAPSRDFRGAGVELDARDVLGACSLQGRPEGALPAPDVEDAAALRLYEALDVGTGVPAVGPGHRRSASGSKARSDWTMYRCAASYASARGPTRRRMA